MPEIRYNRITGDWVIVAPERSKRPADFAAKDLKSPPLPQVVTCPFCRGNEAKSEEQFRLADNDGDWIVRVVTNKFSALTPGGEPTERLENGHTITQGVGLHEVIIENPRHDLTTALYSTDQVGLILQTYLHRFQAFYSDPRIRHVIVYKNHGEEAGTSLEHPHSQIVGLPVYPGQVTRRLALAKENFEKLKTCPGCLTLAEELKAKTRIVRENRSFVAFIPFAALSPYHLWIFPRRHHASFGDIHSEELTDLAEMLKAILYKLYHGVGNPSFNYVIRSLGPKDRGLQYSHWYLAIVPRISTSLTVAVIFD